METPETTTGAATARRDTPMTREQEGGQAARGEAQLADILARLGAAERELATRRSSAPRRRGHARWPATVALALLLGLTPLSLLAANFQDLNPGSPHNADINVVADAGISKGCTDAQHYCPNDNVTREQMASFLARTAGLGGNPPVANALTAVSAETAQNAAQLGGQPASAYVRRGEADFALLLQAILSGPLPATNTFTSHGGSLLVLASGSAYSSAPGNTIGVRVIIDGIIVGVPHVTATEALSHKALSSTAVVVPRLPAGTHTIKVEINPVFPATRADIYDTYNVTILELPIR